MSAAIDEDHMQRTLAHVAEVLARSESVTDVLHDLVEDGARIFRISGAAICMADAHGRLRFVTA